MTFLSERILRPGLDGSRFTPRGQTFSRTDLRVGWAAAESGWPPADIVHHLPPAARVTPPRPVMGVPGRALRSVVSSSLVSSFESWRCLGRRTVMRRLFIGIGELEQHGLGIRQPEERDADGEIVLNPDGTVTEAA